MDLWPEQRNAYVIDILLLHVLKTKVGIHVSVVHNYWRHTITWNVIIGRRGNYLSPKTKLCQSRFGSVSAQTSNWAKLLAPTINSGFRSRSSLVHFACIGIALTQLVTPQKKCCLWREQLGEATQMRAKWIRLNLHINIHAPWFLICKL